MSSLCILDYLVIASSDTIMFLISSLVEERQDGSSVEFCRRSEGDDKFAYRSSTSKPLFYLNRPNLQKIVSATVSIIQIILPFMV